MIEDQTGLFGGLRHFLRQPRKNETEQALFRIVICVLLGGFLLAIYDQEDNVARLGIIVALTLTAIYIFFGIMVLWWMRTHDLPKIPFRLAVMGLEDRKSVV